MKYDTFEETNTRLNNSVILYGGKVAYVNTVTEDLQLDLSLWSPKTKRLQYVAIDDPKLQFRAFPLGYVNLDKGAVYLMRQPARRFKQGLTGETVVILGDHSGQNPYELNWIHIYNKPGFQDCVDGVYPNSDEALKRIKDGVASVAINREIALAYDQFRKDHLVLHKDRKIAFGDAREFILPEDYRYLREICEGYGLKVKNG